MAASNFHTARSLGFLVEFDDKLLAWRAYLAWSHVGAGDLLTHCSLSHRWFCQLRPVSECARAIGLSSFQRQAVGLSIAICAAGILFLALLSIEFDFGNSTGPSRAHPYFTAGRLLAGALIPFALCYVYGLIVMLRPAKSAVLPLAIIAGLIVFVASRRSALTALYLPANTIGFIADTMERGKQAILLAISLLVIVAAVRAPLLPIPLERDEGDTPTSRGGSGITNCLIATGLTKSRQPFFTCTSLP